VEIGGVGPRGAPSVTVETDDAGRYAVELGEIDALSPEARSNLSLSVRARARGHRAGEWQPLAQGDFAGAPRELEGALVLVPGHDVSGRVVDEEGRPLREVRVILYRSGRMLTEKTDGEGRYRFPIEAAGLAFLLAHRLGVGTASIPETPLSMDADLELPDLVLRQGAEIAGTVVNAAGRPVAAVPVFAQCLSVPRGGAKAEIGAPSGTEFGSAVTDAEGRFRITGLFPGLVRLTPVSQGPGVPRGEPLATGRTDVRLVVAGHVLRVAVVDSRGAPLVGARWSVTEADVFPPRGPGRNLGIGMEQGEAGFAVVADGARVRVAASYPGCADAAEVATCEGAGPSQVTLRVVRRGAPGRVRLTLTGESVGRARGQSVNVTSPETGALEGDLDRVTAIGEVIEVPPGKRRIEVLPLEGDDPYEGTPFVPAIVDVDVPAGGDLEVPVPVRLGGRVRIALVWPPGTTQEHLDGVRARSLDGAAAPESLPFVQEAGGQTSWGARMLLDATAPITTAVGLEPGRWILELDVPGYETARVSATVTAGATASVTAVLERKRR